MTEWPSGARPRKSRFARPPPVRLAFDQAEDDAEEAERRENDARRVVAWAGVGIAALVDEEDRAREREKRDGQVDVERPAPAQVRDEPAADERPESSHPADRRAPDPERDRPLLAAERRVDDREGRGQDQRAADTLESAAEEQHCPVRRERREHARRKEDDESDDEDAAPAADVTDASDADEERREDERVDRVRPLRLRDPDVQVADDRRDRDVHDRRVDDDHRDAGRQRDEPKPATSASVHSGIIAVMTAEASRRRPATRGATSRSG